MSNDFDKKLKGLCALNERTQSLLSDGYHIIVNYKDDMVCIVKLRHHNGNRIILKLELENGYLSQFTNNIKNYHDKVC